MKKTMVWLLAVLFAGPMSGLADKSNTPATHKRNVVIFVADGLRAGSANPVDAPTMYWVRTHGVSFSNSHSLFPTFTTPNASAIATGHYLGDTGDYSNTIYSGYPVFRSGNFGKPVGTNTPFVENDPILGDLDSHFDGNYLGEETLLGLARKQGFNTAAVGKLGPVAIQAIEQLNPVDGKFATPDTIIIDDATGTENGLPLSAEISSALEKAGLPKATPVRVQPAGNNTIPGTTNTNCGQQVYFVEAITRAILPMFKKSEKPFVLVYWSRDPDGTQHNQGDSLNKLTPGINGPTSKAAVRNADHDLKQILDYIHNDSELAANTDFFLTSDHGFATISKHDVDALGRGTTSYAAKQTYKDADGRQEVNTGFLPVGFLTIDLANLLKLQLFDPDSQITDGDGHKVYEPVDSTIPQQTTKVRQHPASGNGLLGGTGRILDQTDAKVVVAANGGSDLVYLPDHDSNTLKKIVSFLAEQDYVGGLFIDDAYGEIPGALPLSTIRLVGASKVPLPSVVVSFKTFSMDAKNPLMTAVQIADTGLQQGQGMHGSLGRDNTFNFMAAIGPDFKQGFADAAPAGNADIAPTIAHILGLKLSITGELTGRILEETLIGAPYSIPYKRQVVFAKAVGNQKRTLLMYQRVGKQVYFDRGCFKVSAGPEDLHRCP